jgi:hypothetical protein
MKKSFNSIFILEFVIFNLVCGYRDAKNDKYLRLDNRSDLLKVNNSEVNIFASNRSQINKSETRFRALIGIHQLPIVINATQNRNITNATALALSRKHHDDDSYHSGEFCMFLSL